MDQHNSALQTPEATPPASPRNAAADTVARTCEVVRLGVYTLRKLDRPHELILTDISTLSVLAAGPASIGRIARLSGVTTATASQRVTRMAGRGLVRRSADPADARGVVASLTEQGRVRLDEILTVRRDRLLEHLADLSEEDRLAVDRALPVLHRWFSGFLGDDEC